MVSGNESILKNLTFNLRQAPMAEPYRLVPWSLYGTNNVIPLKLKEIVDEELQAIKRSGEDVIPLDS